LKNNENCFNETKVLQMKKIIISKELFILPYKWKVYAIKHLNGEY